MWDYELLFPTVLFIHAFLKIWVTSEACTRLVEDRRSGALELLLSTPLDVKEIIRGQHLALSRQFFSPLLLLIVLEVLCIAFGFVSANRAKYFLFAAACLLAIDFFTLRWVAMWVGLNAKNVNRAIIKTATLVLALPWFIYNLSNNVLPFLWGNRPHPLLNMITALGTWFVIALITNAVLYFWAKPRLLKQFRALATQPVLAK
jgi:hypothetical protein